MGIHNLPGEERGKGDALIKEKHDWRHNKYISIPDY